MTVIAKMKTQTRIRPAVEPCLSQSCKRGKNTLRDADADAYGTSMVCERSAPTLTSRIAAPTSPLTLSK